MPVQKIVTLREGEELPPGWWLVKMMGKETRTIGAGTNQETLFIALIARSRSDDE